MWRILFTVAVSCLAALSLSFEALCDEGSQSAYGVIRTIGVSPSVGFEMGQPSLRGTSGFEFEYGFGFNSKRFLVNQLFMGGFSKEKNEGSFFVKKSYGLVGVLPFFSSAQSGVQLGAGAIYKIGNEWNWDSGLIFGVEWLGIGGSVSFNGEGASATVTPYLLSPYVGWPF